MKRLALILVAFSLFFSTSQAQEYKLTFEDARKKAVESSEKIKLQQEIITSLEQKNEVQKGDKHQNNPDYEYNYTTKTPVYNNSYQTYDYDKILKDAKEKKKNMVISNEKMTMTLFSNIINKQNEIDNKKKSISNQESIVTQTSAKLKTGKIASLEYDNEVLKLENLKSSLTIMENQLNLDKSKFKTHLNLLESDTVNLQLVEPQLDMLLPADMMKNLEDKKTFKDLQEDLKDLNDDMKWISLVNYGSNYTNGLKDQEKLIKQKKEDIEELKKQTEYNYNKIYYNILIKSNEIALDKINKVILEQSNQKNNLLYQKGLITKNSINSTDAKIISNILSQMNKQLEIRQMLLNYNE